MVERQTLSIFQDMFGLSDDLFGLSDESNELI